MSTIEHYFSDSSGSFHEFQQVCNQIAATTSHITKSEIIRNYLKNFQYISQVDHGQLTTCRGDLYLFMKLMLPTVNPRKYNLKDRKLIKLFSEIFNVDEEEMKRDFEMCGEISDTIRKYLEATKRHVSKSTLTLKQVDTFLNQLSKVTKENDQLSVLRRIVKKSTPDDLMYIVREIKADLRINAGPKIVLDGLHPKAYEDFEAFKASQNLKELCDLVAANKLEVSQAESSEEEGEASERPKKKRKLDVRISLMTPVKPELAKASKSFEDVLDRCPRGFFIETKYDGERVQIHKDGKQFKFFSRNLKQVQPHKVEDVKGYILKAIKADKVILDGELLLVDTKTSLPLPFGTLGIHKRKKYKGAVNGIYLFDILYLEGESLMDKPLHYRRQKLENIISVVPNRIMLSHCILAKGHREDVEALLASQMSAAVATGLEGLVIKDIESPYEPGARHWLKMKKDYLTGMADSADLIVLGSYFGTGSKGGLMSVYLMGCYDTEEKVYKTVCKCGNGHDDDTIQKLHTDLLPMMHKISRDYSKVPKWLEVNRALVPDFVVKDPKNSVVWEISGAEFTESPAHTAAGISIRFPRVTRIRDDKTPNEATTLQELIELRDASKKKAPILLKNAVKPQTALDLRRASEEAVKKAAGSQSEKQSSSQGSSGGKKKDDKKPAKQSSSKQSTSKEDDSVDEDNSDPDPPKRNEESDNEETQGSFIEYVFGSVTKPKDSGDKMIAHCVDNSGRWSQRGDMGAITREFGNIAQEKYEQCHEEDENCEIGDIQVVKAKKKIKGATIWICNLISQKSGRRGAPPIEYAGLEACFDEAYKFVKEKNLVFHFAKPHYAIPNLDWPRIEKLLIKYFVEKGVNVYVYTRDENDKKLCGKKQIIKKAQKTENKELESKKQKSEETQEKEDKSKKRKREEDDSSDPLNLKLLESDEETKSPVKKKKRAGKTPEKEKMFLDSDEETKSDEDSAKDISTSSSSTVLAKKQFKGVNAVISGYSPEETEEIKNKIQAMGGKIQEKWSKLREPSTHLICETFTKVFDHVSKLGGTVVNRKWVDDSASSGKRQREDKYVFPDPASEKEEIQKELEIESSSVPAESTPSQLEKFLSKASEKKRPPKKFVLEDIFTDCKFYLHGTVHKEREVKRYIIAYAGEVVSEFDRDVTHVIADGGWDESLSEFVKSGKKNLKIVYSSWIWECVNKRKLVSTKEFTVEKRKL